MNVEQKLDLRPGEWVVVRSESEILATLDSQGLFDGLLFMPEMRAHCGRAFQVYKRADRTCDPVSNHFMRRMENTVHLKMLRCDGSSHGDCQAGCLIFWKEAWLRRATEDEPGCRPVQPAAVDADNPGAVDTRRSAGAEAEPKRDRAWLESLTRRPTGNSEICFRCQATEISTASRPLPWWMPGQYVRDVRANGVPLTLVLRGLAIAIYSRILRALTGHAFPNLVGMLKRTPSEDLGLQPGDWVMIKTKDEILATLDSKGKNRGLTFESTMLPYCGKRYRVLRRVDQIVDETTGRMKKLGHVSIILDTVICASMYRRSCPRANYLYWREIWLRRAEPGFDVDEGGQQSENRGTDSVAVGPCSG